MKGAQDRDRYAAMERWVDELNKLPKETAEVVLRMTRILFGTEEEDPVRRLPVKATKRGGRSLSRNAVVFSSLCYLFPYFACLVSPTCHTALPSCTLQ
jgi:hypothetical protein